MAVHSLAGSLQAAHPPRSGGQNLPVPQSRRASLCPLDPAQSNTSRRKRHLAHTLAHQLGEKGPESDLQKEMEEDEGEEGGGEVK